MLLQLPQQKFVEDEVPASAPLQFAVVAAAACAPLGFQLLLLLLLHLLLQGEGEVKVAGKQQRMR